MRRYIDCEIISQPIVKMNTFMLMLLSLAWTSCHQQSAPVKERTLVKKDSVVYNITFRDTVIYRYDTVRIKHFVHSDTAWLPSPGRPAGPLEKKKKIINPSNFGIGPSVGAYYSPFNGFDVNIGFGVQYYFLSIPTIRKPNMGHKHRQ